MSLLTLLSASAAAVTGLVARGVVRPVASPTASPRPRPAPQILRAPLVAAVAYTLTAGVGAFDLTGQAASFALERRLASSAGAFVLDGQPAGLRLGRRLVADVGAVTLAGQPAGLVVSTAPGVVARGVVRPVFLPKATGPLTRGATQIVRAAFVRSPVANTLTASVGAFTIEGKSATLTVTTAGQLFVARGTVRPVFTPKGSAPRARRTPQVLRAPIVYAGSSSTLSATVGAFTLAGQPAGLRIGRTMSAAAGAFTLAGQPATLRRGRRVVADVGALTLAGQPAALVRGRGLPASAGAFTLAGQSAGLRSGLSLSAGAGAYTLTGHPVVFTAGVAYVLTAEGAQLGTASPQWPMASQPLASLGPPQASTVGYLLQSAGTGLRVSRQAAAGAYILAGFPVRFVRGPVFRVRGHDRSGGYVLALDASGPSVIAADRSAGYVAGHDFSEGLP